MAANRRCWLMKSEPDVFSIEDLRRDETTPWDGVRNYKARNFMRDDMRVGDEILYYHSNAKPPGVAGLAKIVREAYPDATAQDAKSKYHDPKATPDNPIWMMVDVGFVEEFAHFVSLEELKSEPKLEGMMVTRRGMRLSVQPVEPKHFDQVCKMGRKKG